MQVKTVVQDNLLIAEATSGIADNDGESEASYKTALLTPIKAILEPASTVNGLNYFYTESDNVVGSGDARSDNYIPYTDYTGAETKYGTQAGSAGYTDLFSQNYGVSATGAAALVSGEDSAKPFVDYAFYLKATNTSTSEKSVNITTLTLNYGNNTTVAQKAFRIALFVDAMTGATSGANNAPTTLKSIVKPSGASNFSGADLAVSNATTANGTVSLANQGLVIGTVNAGTTNYFKVIVRMWLEGEDNTCNNETFATLTDSWSLDIVCKMDGTAAVSALTQVIPAAKANLASATLASPAVTVIIDNITYSKIATVQLGGKDLYVQGTSALSSASRIFVIEENLPLEVTTQCTLPTS